MKLFKSIRLSYLEDRDKDPEVQKAIKLLNIRGYDNYTDDKIDQLREMGYDVRKDEDEVSWYFHGQRHRVDGPSVEWANGDKQWYFHGQLHRADGPAVERADGTKYWYFHNKLHRADGPAVERADGYKKWFLNGEGYPKEEFDKIIKSGNIPRP